MKGIYPQAPPQPDFPALEARVGARWQRQRSFVQSVARRPAGARGENEFVFYDGPPFANGLPHFGHLLTGYAKDIVPRYQTMRGRRVERRFGWDCHGLPAEMEAERELGLKGRRAILDYGIARFNNHCRGSVLQYAEQWRATVTRAGRWVDFENEYRSMDASYMESVLWAFKTLHQKGLLYEDYKVMPFSWAAETPVSNFETKMDGAYRERQDPAVTVAFTLTPESAQGLPGGDGAVHLLAWTTTPWTLPSNMALAVGAQIEYAVFQEENGRRVIIGEACAQRYEKELAGMQRIGTLRGAQLAGRRYQPLFPYFQNAQSAFQVLQADFVDVQEGTGIVHMAPGFGEEDMAACRAAGIKVAVPVDEAGCFTEAVADYKGMLVFDANPEIIRALKKRGALLRHETINHSYPHCWRTDKPLIYRAMNSWYVRVSAIKERLLQNNRQVNWIPAHIRDGLFGNWLENARDWSISRNRFWGTPIPVWKSDNPQFPRLDVYGSIAELARDFGAEIADLHRPAIDQLVRPNPDDPSGASRMRRVPDVLDCWFESGSMPYAQAHYPFENKEWFENHFPADYIVEYAAQTRGWFYTMFVLGTALFDKPPFQNCICHGVIVDTKGQKLSKRLRNYPEPDKVFAQYGSDAMRWRLCSSPVLRGGELRIEKDGKSIADAARTALVPLWNAWHFFSLYANADGIRAAKPQREGHTLLDRYLLAKTRELVQQTQLHFDAYDIAAACRAVSNYTGALNNWYIRRSRPRFWSSEKSADKQAAYDTLGCALETLCRCAAPLLPYLCDEIYRGLITGRTNNPDAESVHLCDWPDVNSYISDPQLVQAMDGVRELCSTALALRRQHNIRVRQPLRTLHVAGADVEELRPYRDLIQEEVNVKAVEFSHNIDSFAQRSLHINARALGPRLGGKTKAVIAASKQGDWRQGENGAVHCGGELLQADEYELRLRAKEGLACQAFAEGARVAALDCTLDAALEQEGRARDIVRLVQQARREAGLHVSDRIALALALPAAYREAAANFADYVRENTLAATLTFGDAPDESNSKMHVHSYPLGGESARIALRKKESGE